jgi:hypothetical protein
MENVIAFPLIWLFYPETAGRDLTEVDVIFARAHLAGRRPTLIAEELPPLTAHQQTVMLERMDIHGAEDTESGGITKENVDLDIPPPNVAIDGSGNSTRVPSINGELSSNEKPMRIQT